MSDKPPLITKVKALTPDEEQAFKEGIGRERDAQQGILNEARNTRAELRLKSRDRNIDFLQKIGELSLTFGAALIPLIVATGARKDIKAPAFALFGAALYLANGAIGLWLTKAKIEQDADDSPHVGLARRL